MTSRPLIVIPALLDSDESEQRLAATLRAIPANAGASVLVVAQGRAAPPALQALTPRLEVLHSPRPLTKWGAIRWAREALRTRTEDVVVLIDADDAVEESTLDSFLRRARALDGDLLVGDRAQIQLDAADQRSPHSRVYLEVFTNALLIQRQRARGDGEGDGPDVQSGLYALRREIFAALDLSYVRHYGGELALFHECVERGLRVTRQEYKQKPGRASTYRLARILGDVFALPFMVDPSAAELRSAYERSLELYRRYLPPAVLEAYAGELTEILSLAGLDFEG